MIVTIVEENGTSRDVTLSGPVVRVGRSRENELFIHDLAMSRFHAELRLEGDQWVVVDNGSKNGTYVNKQKVNGTFTLRDGDEIEVGRTRIRLGGANVPRLAARGEAPTSERTIGSLRIEDAPETAMTRILVRAAELVASREPSEVVLREIVQLAARATNAERGMVARSDRGGIQPVAWYAAPGSSQPKISRHILERVLERGEALSLEDLPEDILQQGTIMHAGIRSILCAPLGVERPFRGVLYLDSLLGRADFNASHLEVVTILGGIANVVLEAEANRGNAEKIERMETQLQAAADIQSALLPSGRVDLPGGFSAASFHHACQTVGGDFFDFFHAGDRLGVMLADVSGKGLPAALLMANLHARWHGVRLLGTGPDEWLGRLNDEFLANNVGNKFISMAFALADPASEEMVFASAGHNPALLVEGDRVQELESTGPILGILPGVKFGSVVRPFRPGARLVIYSDGVTDQQDPRGQAFGIERLAESVRAAAYLSPEEIVARIREDLEAFAADAPQDDDTTITVLGRDTA